MKTWPPLRFILFSIAFAVVGVLPTFELTCPIDGGTGILKAAQGLKVESVEAKPVREKEVFAFGECGVARKRSKFTYAVDMLLTNNSSEPSQGTVSVVFNRHAIGEQIMVQNEEGEMVFEEYRPPSLPAFVAVPAETTRKIERVVTFVDDPFQPGEAPYRVAVEAGEDLRDPTCGGTGKLSFVNWLRAIIAGPPSFE